MATPSKGTKTPATCTMTIENFPAFKSYHASPLFYLPSDNRYSFELCLDSNTPITGTRFWPSGKYTLFSLYYYFPQNITNMVVQYRLAVIGGQKTGQKHFSSEGRLRLDSGRQFKELHAFLRDDLLNPVNGLLKENGKLTVHCEIYKISTDISDIQLKPPTAQSSLIQDYAKLLITGRHSDVTLVVNGVNEIKAHCSILSSRCEVFAAMFEHETYEKQQNRVHIEELPLEVVQELVRYLYTDQVEQLEVFAGDLLVAAERYQLTHLKYICEQYLCSSLTTESVAQILALADHHHAEHLRNRCIDYIALNRAKVQQTEGWKSLCEAKPALSREVSSRFSK